MTVPVSFVLQLSFLQRTDTNFYQLMFSYLSISAMLCGVQVAMANSLVFCIYQFE